MNKVKEGYLLWIKITQHIPKNSRYTIGLRMENKFLDLLELARETYFINKENKQLKIDKISECIFIVDTLKFLTTAIWEAKLISTKHLEEIIIKLNEIGSMLGGWRKGFVKKTPATSAGEKQ